MDASFGSGIGKGAIGLIHRPAAGSPILRESAIGTSAPNRKRSFTANF